MAHNFHVFAILLLSILMKSNAYTIETIESAPITAAGTSPFWCKETQSLYYCDPFGTECSMLRYCAADDKTYCASVDGYPYISFIAPIEGSPDKYAVGSNKSVEVVQWDGKSPKAKWIRTVFDAENCTEYQTNNMNAGRADEYGRLFVTSGRVNTCSNLDTIQTFANLFRICAGEPPATLIKPGTLRFPNGMAWDKKNDIFYLIDVCTSNIMAFDYCPYTGDIWNGRIIFNYTDGSLPLVRGLAALEIDKDGNLWVIGGTFAIGDSEIFEIDPGNGKVLFRIPLPAAQSSALCFGGSKMDELYVISIAYLGPNDGRLYVVKDVGARGCKVNKARV